MDDKYGNKLDNQQSSSYLGSIQKKTVINTFDAIRPGNQDNCMQQKNLNTPGWHVLAFKGPCKSE